MQERIFVRIASYRDPECERTIRDAFEKAARPERLRVGVCVQYAPGRDSPNLELGRWAPQVEVLRVRAAKSQGVCWARARAESLWRGEEFSLQVDSHSRFAPGFDDTLLAQLSECADEHAVLSASPGAYDAGGNLERDPAPAMRVVDRFDALGSVRLKGVRSGERWTTPRPSRWIAGGFVFSSARLLAAVPYDPDLYFDQEEAAHSLRLFCAGWNVYVPATTTVFHRYASSAEGPRALHWRDHPGWTAARERGQARFDALVGRRADVRLDPFALGGERSLADFEAVTGVDFLARRFQEPAGLASAGAEPDQEVPPFGGSLRAAPEAMGQGATVGPPRLGVGDALPFLGFVDGHGRRQSLQKLGGAWTKLVVPPALRAPEDDALDRVPHDPSLVVVLREATRALPALDSVWIDRPGIVERLLGAEQEWTLVSVSPSLRVQHIARGATLLPLLRQVARAESPSRRHRAVISRPHAPILHIPSVLDAEERGQLIEMFELGDTFPGRVGPRGGRYDPKLKVREDLILDETLCEFVDQRLGTRVFPEIEKVFGLAVTYREPYKLAAYDAAQRGFFQAHRDNLEPELRYRRFALTINLNDDFAGGEVAFPEYERSAFRVPAGDAVVFSCSLLHEARPVLRGTRKILLGFVAGASAQALLEAAGKEERFRLASPVLRLGLPAD